MTPHTHEPLTPEERELAQRLSRLGPHGGPSPALDAKILAAAHAAVAGPAPRRRRWWALSAVPGSLVTGAGMAAALALVVGVVWQMRPSTPPAQLPADDGDMGYISAEILERPAPAAAPAPPPPAPTEPARVVSADAASSAAPAPAPAPARRQAPAAKARAEAPAPSVASAPAMDDAAAADTGAAVSETYAAAPMVAATPPAEAQAQARHLAAQEAERESKATLDRVEVTGSRVRSAKAMAAPPAPAAPAAMANTSSYAETAGLMAPAQSLREVPVTLDAALDADAWMQRIRARRDEGDLDGARASLAEFRKTHPTKRLPDDLRALAQPTR